MTFACLSTVCAGNSELVGRRGCFAADARQQRGQLARGKGSASCFGEVLVLPRGCGLLPRGSGTPGEEARSSGGAQEAATVQFLSCVFSSCSSGSVWSLCPVFIGLTGLKMSVHCPPLMKFSAKRQRTCPNFDSVLSLASRVMFTGLHAGRT